MSSQQLEVKRQRRTSQRRRLKLLKNSNQFRIPNPFKVRHKPLPQHIANQLSRIDFLSSSAILMLTPYKYLQACEDSEITLASMQEALIMQEHRFCALVGVEPLESISIAQNTCNTEQSRRTVLEQEINDKKDQIPSRNIYDPLDPRKQEDFPVLGLIEVDIDQNEVKVNAKEQIPHQFPILVQEEIQNYFAQ